MLHKTKGRLNEEILKIEANLKLQAERNRQKRSERERTERKQSVTSEALRVVRILVFI